LIETARRELVMPRRRFALPLHLSVWPFATRRDRTAEPQLSRSEPQRKPFTLPQQCETLYPTTNAVSRRVPQQGAERSES
ncbi:hypothetical protein IH781_03430, partial [Patescibacteria group bacterium]|nr:hypothetical protein [Patescibacteria group bacterium]